jgi:hypothetical protein
MSADRPDDDDHLDALVARLASVNDTKIRDHPEDEAAQALLDRIVVGDLTTARRAVVPGERARPPKVVTVTVAALVAGVLLVVALTSLLSSPTAYPTAGVPVVLDTPAGSTLTARIPRPDLNHGRIVWSKVPTFVAVFSGRTLIGYVKKTAIEHPPLEAEPQLEPAHLPKLPNGQVPPILRFCTGLGVDVYNGSHMLIGHVYPGTGYVALGGLPVCRQ